MTSLASATPRRTSATPARIARLVGVPDRRALAILAVGIS